ncbi:MAG: 5-formyltetrahydrofolate cyclo-ligase [Patescibacteria group bacterium]
MPQGIELISSLLSSADRVITYEPLRSEVAINELLGKSALAEALVIPPRPSLDPVSEAKRMVTAIGSSSTVICIPGRLFDGSGTRHGQGGGWYDRFLAEVPREWLRIGFCFTHQFSTTPLKRESWDQAMDYVVVVDQASGEATVYSSEGIL